MDGDDRTVHNLVKGQADGACLVGTSLWSWPGRAFTTRPAEELFEDTWAVPTTDAERRKEILQVFDIDARLAAPLIDLLAMWSRGPLSDPDVPKLIVV